MKEMLTGGEEKSLKYAQRILAGEDKESVLKGLGPVFRGGVEKQLSQGIEGQEKNSEKKPQPTEEVKIPAQFEGLDSETLDFIWTIPEYVDQEKTNQEKQRKQKVLEFVKKKEQEQLQSTEKRDSEQEDIEKIKNNLHNLDNQKRELGETSDYTEFRMKRGETDEGFFWYEYRNKKAKDLKNSGQFEWGKERIYFDIKINDCEKLRDLAIKVSGDEQIPIAFKYIDVAQTFPVHKDGRETRFVANFVSSDDARKFYLAISRLAEYPLLVPDRELDYKGIRVDSISEYASGFREKRGALERIMSAKLNREGNYEYASEDGRKVTISTEQFILFKNQYDKLEKEILKEKEKWSGI